MGTQTVAPSSANISTERTDYVVGWDVETKDGKEEKTPAYYVAQSEEDKAAVKKLVDEKKFEEAYAVTASLPLAKNFDGIKAICPNEEEACNNFNRGAKQKAANRLKAKLLDVDQDGTFTFGEADLSNGVYDLTQEIASESKRKMLSEEEKMDKFLAQFPENIRNNMKAAYLASVNTPAAA